MGIFLGHNIGMARPRLEDDQRKEVTLKLRMRSEHDQLIRAAAEDAGLSISGWMRDRLLKAAREELGRDSA